MNYNEPKNECQQKDGCQVSKKIQEKMFHRLSWIDLTLPEQMC